MPNNNTDSNKVEFIHPIFHNVKAGQIRLVKQSQILLILKMRTEGFSYNQISRRLFAEYNINLTPQRIGKLINKYGESYGGLKV